MKRTQPVLIVAMLAMAVLGVPRSVRAVSAKGLTISPPSYSLRANPGETLSNTIRITNNAETNVTVQVSAQDFTVTDHEGSVSVAITQTPQAFSNWFSFKTTKFPLASKATALVPFTIHVPGNAEPGGHFASILFSPVAQPGSVSTGASVIQRIGSLILMSVNGNVTESGSIDQFRTKTYRGSWTTVTASDGQTKILVAENEDLTKEKPRRFFNQGPVAFDLTFKNTGNTYFAPTGTVSIYNLFGHKVDQLSIDPRNVFPGNERRVTVIWPEKHLSSFYYRAEVTAVYGGQNKILTTSTVFFGFPLTILIVVVIAIGLIVLLRKRLRAAFSVLVKGR